MLYYWHHIGDYLRDTAHLSLMEHGVYLRLMQIYYMREEPFSSDQAVRLSGARTADEIEAVHYVLKEFWTQTEDGWIQRRCLREILDARVKAATSKTNGRKGGNPKKKRGYNEPGYLYAAQKPTGGLIKVGITKYLPQRISALRAQHGVVPIEAIMVTDMGSAEGAVHEHFASRLDGEWIDTSVEELRAALLRILVPFRSPMGSVLAARGEICSPVSSPTGTRIATLSGALTNTPILPVSNTPSTPSIHSEAQTHSGDDPDDVAEWFSLRQLYPRGTYREVDFMIGEREARRRIGEGFRWDQLRQGARAYAAQCEATGKSGTQYVMSVARFFAEDPRMPGQYPFLDPFPLPAENGKKPHVPAKSLAELEHEAIAKGLADGLTDEEIATRYDIAIERVSAARKELPNGP